MEKHPLHFKSPELQTSPEVERAVERKKRTGEKVPNNPNERIEAYMDRLENIFLNPDEEKRERNIDRFRPQIYDALLIKRDNFPESYFELQKRVARERGQAVEEIPENVREQMKDVAIEDQKHSLDAWIDYLSSEDAVYPAWFKFYVWNQVIKLSQFDKERGEFKKRTSSTVAPYPDIYREPLAQIADIYEKVKEDNTHLKEAEIQEAFSKKFPALYAELIQKSLASQIENREEIQGQWVKYSKGNNQDAEKLFNSLENKGTGWCTAGRSTAQAQIKSGDFYVYYTNDQDGNPIQPRLAIRMDGTDKIGEVRGILPHQNVEPLMQETLDKKLQDFGSEADHYHKKSEDMKRLTELERKTEQGQELTKDDLIFLYEIDSPIEGFGYGKDPRIQELRSKRKPREDAPIVLDCEPSQIAWKQEDINENTKAYIGPLFKDIFQKNIEHIYASFPEGKIRKMEASIGGESKENLIKEMKDKFKVSDYALSMLESADFTVSKNKETIDIVRLKVRDLGFPSGATVQEIYQRAEEFGLELCPAETGPQLRKQYLNQPTNEWFRIAMKQIAGSGGGPSVFDLYRDGADLWLIDHWARPDGEWGADGEIAFRFRKLDA